MIPLVQLERGQERAVELTCDVKKLENIDRPQYQSEKHTCLPVKKMQLSGRCEFLMRNISGINKRPTWSKV